MSVTTSEHRDFLISDIATGFITRFYNGPQLGGLFFNQTYTESGHTVVIQPISRPIVSHQVQDGIMKLPGGRVYSPWGLAGDKAPTHYPTYSQQILYHGHIDITMQYYQHLLGRVGLTGELRFTYGQTSGGPYGAKQCEAMLLSATASQERPFDTALHPTKTYIIFTAVWQQTGRFWAE